jgi:hypothetical protein
MALSSLKYNKHGADHVESKGGFILYGGSASSYHEWRFRVEAKRRACRPETIPTLASLVIDSLRGEALQCAMELGLDKLQSTDGSGLTLLCDALQSRIFPIQGPEARDLLKS